MDCIMNNEISWSDWVIQLLISNTIYIYIYGIHHWRITWSSYRKLAWVRFEPTTTEFCLDALTNWAIRPWIQLTLRANSVQLLQLHCLLVSSFISAIAFDSQYIYIYIHMLYICQVMKTVSVVFFLCQ